MERNEKRKKIFRKEYLKNCKDNRKIRKKKRNI